jgi:redox-sensitive bicupin YhaK (pirin superfamily)
MPAVTVPDITLLARTPVADLLTARPRPVTSLSTAPSGFEGEGFPVRRAFMGAPLAAIDPFIMLDQMGEVEYAPGEPKGTPWHPHRGFETVTYMLDGILDHRDSNGGGGRISDGDTQWMTAGGGILHIETTRVPGREWRPLPRLPTLGESAARQEVVAARLPRHSFKRSQTPRLA